jgi:hypothetical protein
MIEVLLDENQPIDLRYKSQPGNTLFRIKFAMILPGTSGAETGTVHYIWLGPLPSS